MTVFVSYARRDNDDVVLRRIEDLLSRRRCRLQRMLTPQAAPFLRELFSPRGRHLYIDDLDHRRNGTDRHDAVEGALLSATSFLVVESPAYRKTPWTTREFEFACQRDLRIFTLSFDRATIDLYLSDKNRGFEASIGSYVPELV